MLLTLFNLNANGIHFSIDGSIGYGFHKDTLQGMTGWGGVCLGYRWVNSNSKWFLDWNFLDMHQRWFRFGKIIAHDKLALYGIVSPLKLLAIEEIKVGLEFMSVQVKIKSSEIGAGLGIGMGIGASYQMAKNVSVTGEVMVDIGTATTVDAIEKMSASTLLSTVFTYFVRPKMIVGFEFHPAKHNL